MIAALPPIPAYAFSVTAGSVGAPGSAVFAESGGFGAPPGEQSADPEDNLVVIPGGPTPIVFAAGAGLGLVPGDDLNALDIILEPGTTTLLIGGLLILIRSRRRAS